MLAAVENIFKVKLLRHEVRRWLNSFSAYLTAQQADQLAVLDYQTISCRLENMQFGEESMMVGNHSSYNDIANFLLHPSCIVHRSYATNQSNAYPFLSSSPTTTDRPSRCKQPSYYWPGWLSSNLGMFQLFLLRSEQLLSTLASDSVILLLVHHQLRC